MERQVDTRTELLFRAIGGVGADLIDSAEHRRFSAGFWRRALPAAACLVLLAGLCLLTLPQLRVQDQPLQPEQPAQTSGPAQKPQMPAVGGSALPQQEEKTAAVAKERIVVLDTVYYVEAFYTDEEAAPHLGQVIGTVTRSDRDALVGEPVYARKDCLTQQVDDMQIPMEVFVLQENGWCYCLTYFVQTGPLLTFEDAANWQSSGQWERLAGLLTLELPLFDRGADLTEDELVQVFLASVEAERLAGVRTEDLNRYLWLEDGRYVIPVSDLTRQLDRYLEEYRFRGETCTAFDESRQALVLEDLTPQSRDGMLLPADTPVMDADTREVVLVTACYDRDGDTALQEYTIRFTEEGCIFCSIRNLEG